MPREAIHPGTQLGHILGEAGLSAAELARRIGVPTNRVTQIINGQRSVTGDTALRLGHFFGNSPEFWMNLQKGYELRIAESVAGNEIRKLPKFKMKTRSGFSAPRDGSRA
jgi:addiction module HigA family antidote